LCEVCVCVCVCVCVKQFPTRKKASPQRHPQRSKSCQKVVNPHRTHGLRFAWE